MGKWEGKEDVRGGEKWEVKLRKFHLQCYVGQSSCMQRWTLWSYSTHVLIIVLLRHMSVILLCHSLNVSIMICYQSTPPQDRQEMTQDVTETSRTQLDIDEIPEPMNNVCTSLWVMCTPFVLFTKIWCRMLGVTVIIMRKFRKPSKAPYLSLVLLSVLTQPLFLSNP
jgi:hypothetical protein